MLFWHKGDHLLTAINVARDCGMLPPGESVILVTATPPSNEHSSATIKYSLAEMFESDSREHQNNFSELVNLSVHEQSTTQNS
jgi:magnesium-transporting ATPase (P-type)